MGVGCEATVCPVWTDCFLKKGSKHLKTGQNDFGTDSAICPFMCLTEAQVGSMPVGCCGALFSSVGK